MSDIRPGALKQMKWPKGSERDFRGFVYEPDETASNQTVTTVKFFLRNMDTGVLVVNDAVASQVAPNPMELKYAWASGETDIDGWHRAWFTYLVAGVPEPTTPVDVNFVEEWEMNA